MAVATLAPKLQATRPKTKLESSLKPKQKKKYVSLSEWGKTTKRSNPVPEFFKKAQGKHRFFSALSQKSELYKVKITYEKLNTQHGFISATMSLKTIINGDIDHYMYHIMVSLDKNNSWKPKTQGFKVSVHSDNEHDFAEDMLKYLKSPASRFEGNIRKYLFQDKIVDTKETHKNVMGCLIKNGFSQFYAASTEQKNNG